MWGLVAFISAIALSVAPALACDQTIVLTNWKSCAVGTLSEQGGSSGWDAVPTWTRSPKLQPFFFQDPRLLASHGLCNEKFHRVVLCLPGWKETTDKNACWFLICSGHQAAG